MNDGLCSCPWKHLSLGSLPCPNYLCSFYSPSNRLRLRNFLSLNQPCTGAEMRGPRKQPSHILSPFLALRTSHLWRCAIPSPPPRAWPRKTPLPTSARCPSPASSTLIRASNRSTMTHSMSKQAGRAAAVSTRQLWWSSRSRRTTCMTQVGRTSSFWLHKPGISGGVSNLLGEYPSLVVFGLSSSGACVVWQTGCVAGNKQFWLSTASKRRLGHSLSVLCSEKDFSGR